MTALPSTSARDIINQALKACGAFGVGQTPLAEDMNDAFTQLNWMIAQWQRKRWLVYSLETLSINSTGAVSYTVGPMGDIAVASRPDRLEAAFFRQVVQSQPNEIDYPLIIIPSREDYNNIALKTLQTFPMYIFYESTYPLGRVYVWPVAQPQLYSIFITIKQQLNAFANLADPVTFPEEYIAAIFWNLTARLGTLYKLPEDPRVVGLAKDSLNLIRGANTQISNLKMPTELIRRGIYNIFSDQFY